MINRTNEIKRIIKENGYTSYLEIGLGNGSNFKEIDIETKIGIDPAVSGKDIGTIESDTFFEHCQDTFDLIFIDGLHHADQVERDIINSWNVLNKGGQWTGDVWRSWYGLKNTYPKLRVDYIDERVGIAIIHKSRHKIEAGFTDFETAYQIYNNLKGWEV